VSFYGFFIKKRSQLKTLLSINKVDNNTDAYVMQETSLSDEKAQAPKINKGLAGKPKD